MSGFHKVTAQIALAFLGLVNGLGISAANDKRPPPNHIATTYISSSPGESYRFIELWENTEEADAADFIAEAGEDDPRFIRIRLKH